MSKSFGRVITGIASLGISEIFRDTDTSSSSKPQTPTAPTQDDADAAAQATAAKKRIAAARSYSVYTSPLGLEYDATKTKKMLLGE